MLAYIEIEQEPKPTEVGKPPAAWPTSGELHVENLSARYSKVTCKFYCLVLILILVFSRVLQFYMVCLST